MIVVKIMNILKILIELFKMRGPLSRQRKSSKRENRDKKEIDHLHNNSSQPSYDHTSRQRTKNDRPHGSRPLRPIASRSKVSKGYGARNARQCCQKSSQNSNQTHLWGESDIQSFIRTSETPPAVVLHLNHAPNTRLLLDLLWE